MKYSYKWLKELSGTKKSAEEIANLLTFHSFEIEGIEKNKNAYDKVVVGEILEIFPHPDADKLQLTKVNVGKEILDIVCGARNIEVGDKVPVALVGAKLPVSAADGSNFLEIREAEIRGVKSFGMLCASDELGMGSDHSGIMILGKDLKVGISLSEALELDDATIEIDVLANRAHDALSHIGMAREISVVEKKELDYDYDGLVLPKKKSRKLKVAVSDKTACSRYIGAVMENIKVADSPQWLKNRLEKAGLRPINNIVDATNFVMLELGQPLHAFDFQKIGNEIRVRRANEDEEIKILDGSFKKLTKNDIVIADKEKAVALAGVMGGFDSGVTKETTSIVLEAANFEASSIRRTRMNLNLPTDAAIRFEKTLDPNLAEKAMVRVIEIIEHIAGGELEGISDEYLKKSKSWSVKLDLNYVDKLLGENVPVKKSKEILSLLGMKVKGGEKVVSVEIPTFRIDLRSQEDLIEEIGRIYGYEKIKAVAPLVSIQSPRPNNLRIFERKLKGILVSQGFDEVYNYSFYGKKEASLMGISIESHVELGNSLNVEQNLMRRSLFPGLLKNVRENLKNFKDFSIFEIGRVYIKSEEILPQEKNMLCAVMVLDSGADAGQAAEFFEAKGMVDNFLKKITTADYRYESPENGAGLDFANFWHLGRAAELKLKESGKSIGFLGEISPAILSNLGIKTRVVAFEFSMDNLDEISKVQMQFDPIRKYPVLSRDISLLSEKSIKVDTVLDAISRFGGELVLGVELFDIFNLAGDSKSFAFHITFGSRERTLSGSEIDAAMDAIIKGLDREYGLKIRQ